MSWLKAIYQSSVNSDDDLETREKERTQGITQTITKNVCLSSLRAAGARKINIYDFQNQ